MCLSKHFDRTRSGPGSEHIRRVNSILPCGYLPLRGSVYMVHIMYPTTRCSSLLPPKKQITYIYEHCIIVNS